MNPEPAHKEKRPEVHPCFLNGLTEEEQKAAGPVIESLVGASDEELEKKLMALGMTAVEAANAGHDKEAQQAALTLLVMAGAKALKDPSEDGALAYEASRRADAGDWVGAEAAYRKLLRLREQEGRAGMIAKAQFDLSRLLRHLGRLDEAWGYACAATKAGRREDLPSLTVMMLENEALCALERKDVSRALAAAEEALSLLKPERIQNAIRMRMLTIRAQCLLESGNAAGAESDLKSARELEADSPFGQMGGALVAQARRWETQAALQVRRGDLTGASESLKEVIALRQKMAEGCGSQSPYDLAAQARALERFAEVSRQLGHAAAVEALSEAKAVHEQVHLPLPSGKTRNGKTSRTSRRRRFGSASSGSANPKVLLLIAALVLGGVAMAAFWSFQVHRSREQLCVNQMRNLQSAAVSYCLEHKLGPGAVVSVGDLATYTRSLTVCPRGGISYPAFSVLQGPSCPNGHLYRPGAPRPLRAADPKTAGLYLKFGLTDLITPEAMASRAAIDNELIRSETNRTPPEAGSRD